MRIDLKTISFVICALLLSLYLAIITFKSFLNINFWPAKNSSVKEKAMVTLSAEIPIIIYHYVEIVTDERDFIRKGLSITPATFQSQIKTLKVKGYQTFFVRDIPGIIKGQIRVNKKPVSLNFDDGYADFYSDVFPIIKKENIKVTVYIVPQFIGHLNYMTKEQIYEIIASGLVEIGSHTNWHVDLPSVSLERAKAEIIDSKTFLDQEFKIKVETFCYPYGYYNETIANLVKSSSYTAAVSEVYGTTQSIDNLYFLSRIRVGYFNTIF